MQPLSTPSSRSYSSRNYCNRTEGSSYHNHGVLYDNPQMLLSGSTSAMHGRVPTSVNQNTHTRSYGPVDQPSMYLDSYVPTRHLADPLSRSMGQMSFGNDYDSRARSAQRLPDIPHDYPPNFQDSDRFFTDNAAPQDIQNRYEESPSSSAVRRSPKLYTCEICDKQFVRPSSLTTHRFSHTGEKPHTCPTCGKAFSVASNLRRHETTIHGPRMSNSGTSYDAMNRSTSGELQRASLVGSTNSSIIYQRGSDIYENLLPSHERFNEPRRRM